MIFAHLPNLNMYIDLQSDFQNMHNDNHYSPHFEEAEKKKKKKPNFTSLLSKLRLIKKKIINQIYLKSFSLY